jgi:hypothetical protein
VFCASKNYLYFITVNSKAVELLLILLLLFSKVLKPNTCFVLTLYSTVGDGFSSPSQPRTATVCCTHIRNSAIRHCRYKSTLAAQRLTTKKERTLTLAKVRLAIPCKQPVTGLWQLRCNFNGDCACANGLPVLAMLCWRLSEGWTQICSVA